jgi:toxin YoeB
MEQLVEKYIIDISKLARNDLKKHMEAGNKATLRRIERIIAELEITPFNGIGNPEALKYNLSGFWARRITGKDRMVDKVDEESKTVFVASAMGHYR